MKVFPKTLRSFRARVDRIEIREQSAVIDVRMGDEHFLLHSVESRYQLREYSSHLGAAVRISRIDEKIPAAAPDYRRIAAARRLDQDDVRIVGDAVLGDTRCEIRTARLRKQLAEAADAVERAVRRYPRFVKLLHRKIGIDEKRLARIGGYLHERRKLIREMNVEHAVVVDFVRAVVVDDADRAQLARLRKECVEPLALPGDDPHLEILIVRAVLLRADIRNVEAEFAYQLEHGGDASGNVAQSEFKQYHAPPALVALQVADLRQPPRRLVELIRRSLRVDEQHMRIHRLVVADARYVHADLRKASACL